MTIGTITFDVTEEVEGVLSLADNVTVSVLETGTANQATIYEDITGAETVANPFVVADGKVEIFADAGKRYDIVLTDGGSARTIPAVSVSTPPVILNSGLDGVVDIGGEPDDGASDMLVRLWRSLTSTGSKIIQVFKGDGSTDVAAALTVNSGGDGLGVIGKIAFAGQVTANERVSAAGTYDKPFLLDALRLWSDSGNLRFKNDSDPANAGDGSVFDASFTYHSGNPHSASGATVTIGSIPAGVQEIVVDFEAITTTDNDALLLEMGNGTGFALTDYEGVSTTVTGTGTAADDWSGDGAVVVSPNTFGTLYGRLTMTRMDASLRWSISISLGRTGTLGSQQGGGRAVLDTSALTQLRLSLNAAATFSGGSVRVAYR